MKVKRQNKILELISKYDIETQEELSSKLKQSGMDITQATVSRDIKELRLIKVLSQSGKYKYAVSSDEALSEDKNTKAILLSIKLIRNVGNTIVVKCIKGTAQAVAIYLDKLDFPEIIGSVAGHDTIFILTAKERHAEKITNELLKML